MVDDTPRVSKIVFRDAPTFSGPVLRRDGRLCLVNEGRGLSIQLSALQIRDFAREMITVSALLAEREAAAADEAGADLERILAAGHG